MPFLLSVLLKQNNFTLQELEYLLSLQNQEQEELHKKAYQIKLNHHNNKIYLRGLIEISNICTKNCFYCGIRKENTLATRYQMTFEEILKAALLAHQQGYGSLVIQGGERTNLTFINKITHLLATIKEKTQGQLGITLSLGEQKKEVYQEWFKAGAHRYLLRIETSNPKLYQTIHPKNQPFKKRLQALENLKELGYQTGTGVMIGFFGQTLKDLAKDLLFFKKFDIDMVGMGPYIEHSQSVFAQKKDNFWNIQNRLETSLNMIALLRLLMPNINIAATTALQTLDSLGLKRGFLAGANVVMPNLTLPQYKKDYNLYQGKAFVEDSPQECQESLFKIIQGLGQEVGYHLWGDSLHFKARQKG